MTMLISIVSFLIVIVVLILAHEVGHLITAKVSRVRVDEFGLGFPPRLLSIKWGETMYSLNAIPLGGFVKMAGEEDPKVPRSLASKSIGTRLLVLISGSLMNAILPILLFSIAFMVPHSLVIGSVVVEEVVRNSPAAKAGIEAGDEIVSINDKPVRNISDVHRYIQFNLGEEIAMVVDRGDLTTEEMQVIPRWRPPEGQGAVGIAVGMSDPVVVSQQYPIWKAIPMGAGELIETFGLFKNGILSMIIGTAPAAVVGPVGIAQMTGEVAQAGISPLLEFAAFLSINLAIINMLPLPALDGGRVAFVLVEGVRRGKRVSPKTEGLVHLIGFTMLMALFLLITYQDIIRIIGGESFIP